VLEAEQGGEEEAGLEQGLLALGVGEGENENAVEEAVVLEVDVVDDEQSGREEDCQSSGLGRFLGGRFLDEPTRLAVVGR
jgi:hypothetical protein